MSVTVKIINENYRETAVLAVITKRPEFDPSDSAEIHTTRISGGESTTTVVNSEQYLEIREVFDDFDDMPVHTNVEPS